MAKPAQLDYQLAIDGIDEEKFWPAGQQLEWICLSTAKFPRAYKFRGGLLVGGVQPEGLFIELFSKASPISGVPDTVNMGLFVQNCLVLALHENGPGRHQNKVGVGRPRFRQAIDHPHLHMPVREASYGYCEPVERRQINDLWHYFLAQANIIGAPNLDLPGGPQGELDL